MSDITVTVNPPITNTITISDGVLPHNLSHSPSGSDSLATWYASKDDLVYVSGQISAPSGVVFTTGDQTINGVKNFSSRPTVNGSGVMLTGETAGTGYLTGYVNKSETGSFVSSDQTGQFYPATNPSDYATTSFVTGISGHQNSQISSLQSVTGNLNTRLTSVENVTGSFALSNNTGAFLTTGAADIRYINATGDSLSGNLEIIGDTSGQSFTLKNGGYIDFQTGTPSWREGRVFYDSDSHSLSYYNDQSDVTINLGQEQVVRVSNGWTGTIPNGSVVVISGAAGNRPQVIPASATFVNPTGINVLGVATQDISSQGYVTVNGLVNNLDTLSYSEGDLLFLSTVSGQLTTIAPASPNHRIRIATVIRSHLTQGSILVHVDEGSNIALSHDVVLSNPQNSDILRYVSGSGVWTNSSLNTGDFITNSQTGDFYPASNPSGFITGINTGSFLTLSDANLRYVKTSGDSITGRTSISSGNIGATNISILTLGNTGLATLNNQQWSPSIELSGNGWSTASGGITRPTRASVNLVPIQSSAEPAGRIDFSFGNGTGALSRTVSIHSNPNYNAPWISTFNGSVGLGAGNFGLLQFIVNSSEFAVLGLDTFQVGSNYSYSWSNGTTVGNIATKRAELFSPAAATIRMGANNASTATNQTFKAHDVTAGTGANLTLAGGTGSLASGQVILHGQNRASFVADATTGDLNSIVTLLNALKATAISHGLMRPS